MGASIRRGIGGSGVDSGGDGGDGGGGGRDGGSGGGGGGGGRVGGGADGPLKPSSTHANACASTV